MTAKSLCWSCSHEGETINSLFSFRRQYLLDTRRECSCSEVKEKTGGSTFKNPPGHSAWKLIDEAGMRGYRVGGAQMSPMHCNFMINTDDATAYDLEMLGETVREKVLENSGIQLDWEIKRVGRFASGKVVPSAG